MSGDSVTLLLADLTAACDAGQAMVGREVLGLRAVEPGTGGRSYLVAFDGPSFLCLDGSFGAERSLVRVRAVAHAGLVVEHAEALIDPAALRAVGPISVRLAPWEEQVPAAVAALRRAAAAADDLAEWREDPLRAVASLPALDDALIRHERVRGAYAAFVQATDPLVERQDSLDAGLLQVLTEVESVAATAGLAAPLAGFLAQSMQAIGEGADEMVAAILTPLV